jgi:hypothetical protein
MSPALPEAVHRRLRPLVGPESLHDRPHGFTQFGVMASRALEHLRPPVPRRLTARPPEISVVGVYRRRNADVLARLLEGVPPDRVHLWALDEAAPALAPMTAGTGPGTRFVLLNRLAPRCPPGWLVIADDDVELDGANLPAVAALARAAHLDVAQPAHARDSHLSWSVTRRRLTTIARRTRFVEQGPLMVLGPHGRAELLPFPEDRGMGWGVEAVWARIDHLRFGVLDAAAMRHVTPVQPSGNYDVAAEWAQAERLLAVNGFASFAEVQVELDRWPLWRPAAPWG